MPFFTKPFNEKRKEDQTLSVVIFECITFGIFSFTIKCNLYPFFTLKLSYPLILGFFNIHFSVGSWGEGNKGFL